MFFYRNLVTAKEIGKKDRSIAIGGFDGIHLGHQQILKKLNKEASKKGNHTLVFSFEPTPKEFFSPLNPPSRLTKFRERYKLIKNYGIHEFFCPNFQTVRDLGPTEFIKKILVDGLNVSSVTVGDDFKFASNRLGTIEDLYIGGEQYGFDVNVIQSVFKDNDKISSTVIRNSLDAGDLETSSKMLGRDYSMSGRVVYGQGLGKKLGFPTANINLNRIRAPIKGIFAVRVEGLDKIFLDGVASIGNRPTIGGNKELLEVYIFDFDKDIYNELITIHFIKKIREEIEYKNLDSLVLQMAKDVDCAKVILAA